MSLSGANQLEVNSFVWLFQIAAILDVAGKILPHQKYHSGTPRPDNSHSGNALQPRVIQHPKTENVGSEHSAERDNKLKRVADEPTIDMLLYWAHAQT